MSGGNRPPNAPRGRETAPGGDNGAQSRRHAVRLSTVYGGRVCQYGRAYACIISDVSVGGAKVRLKNPLDFGKITQTGDVQLVFERLSDYKALNTEVAWVRPEEHIIGLRFTDPEVRRRVVLKRLMPNRWRIANQLHDDAQASQDEAADGQNEREPT